MFILGLVIFIVNDLLCVFSLNLVFKKKNRIYVIHSIAFFVITMIEIINYRSEYLYEAIFSFIIFGLPVAFEDKLLPSFIKVKNNRLTYILIFDIIICSIIFYMI